MMLQAAAVVVGAIAICLVARRLVLRRHRHLRNMAQLQDQFFAAAIALARDPETPPTVLDRLEFMARSLDRSFGAALLVRAVSGSLREAVEEPGPQTRDMLAQLNGMSPEQRERAEQSFTCFALAVSFNNLLLGSFIRRFMLYWIKGVERASPVVLAMIGHR